MSNTVEIELNRFLYHPVDGTFGVLSCGDRHFCYTIEEVWRENQRKISCVPCGRYRVKTRQSAKYGNHLILEGVPNRSFILFHVGNDTDDTEGCILPNENLSFGERKLKSHIVATNSKAANQELVEFVSLQERARKEVWVTISNIELPTTKIDI